MCGKIDPISPPAALVCMLLNIFFCPLGTWIHACMSERYHVSFLVGLGQFILLPLFPLTIIGWIWAIVYGIQIYQVSADHARKQLGGYILQQQMPIHTHYVQ